MPYRLPDAQSKPLYLRQRFDQIARHYDLFNDLITQGRHRHWKNVLVKRLNLRPGARGADLCCGTGDIAARTLAALGGKGGVVALDFAPAMLRLAKSRLERRPDAPGLPLVMQGDAGRLPFADDSLDFVTVGYGLRNVADLAESLREIRRALVPGGVLASLDLGKVRSPWLSPLADFYMFRVVPRIGRLLQPGQEMFDYLPHSNRNYPEQGVLREMMLSLGFAEVEMIEFLFGASVIHLARKKGAAHRG